MPINCKRTVALRGRIVVGVLLAASFALIGALWPASADAQMTPLPFDGKATPSLLHPVKAIKQPSVGSRCVRAQMNRGSFELVNRCPICRSVQVQHTRPNNRPPILRDYFLPPNGKVTLPFKGKGRSRVLNDTTCEKNDKGAKAAEKTSQACVRIRRDAKGLVLLNVCGICKAGIVERLFRDGRREQQTLAIASRAFTPVASGGAQSARLVSEVPCR